MKRVGILTAGGDCPGLNAVIRSVTKALVCKGDIDVYGFEDGFTGLIERRMRRLTWNSVSGILTQGGTILGSDNKANPFRVPVKIKNTVRYEDCSDEALDYIREIELDVVVAIGGDGTMAITNKMCEKGMNAVGVPKTIDNDIVGTDITFGYDSAMTTAAEAIDKIHSTAQSHHRVMVVEVMGRYAGWLTLGAGIAAGADVILIPEIPYNLEKVQEVVAERSHRGRRFSIIAVAEGAKPIGGDMVVSRTVSDSTDPVRLGGIGNRLANEIEDATGLESRVTVLGHLQRGGTPTPFDRVLSTRFGVATAELVAKGDYGRMVALHGSTIDSVPLVEVGGKCRTVPSDSDLIHIARMVGTHMGD